MDVTRSVIDEIEGRPGLKTHVLKGAGMVIASQQARSMTGQADLYYAGLVLGVVASVRPGLDRKVEEQLVLAVRAYYLSSFSSLLREPGLRG